MKCSSFFDRFSGRLPLRSLSILGACALFFLAAPGISRAIPPPPGLGMSVFDSRETAPEIEAPDLSGRAVHLSDYRGKVVLLNFWATWCDPCRREIPSLLALKEKLSGAPFVVVSVAMDRRTRHIAPFVRKYSIDYPVMEGRKGRVDSRYYGLGLPQTYVIDRNGRLVGRVVGGRNWASPSSVSYFRALAASGSPGKPSSKEGK
jgi:thiol-disulfide isomerase/thioredoxin